MRDNPFSDLPDVLEARGFTPRELGAVHAALDGATLGSDGAGWVDLWLQAAFSGAITAEARLAVHEPIGATIEAEPTRARVALADGEVRRFRFVFRVTGTVRPTELRCLVDAPLKQLTEDATRVRPAWKLLDTVVQPGEGAPVSTVDLLPVGIFQQVVRPLRSSGGAKPSEATRVERARMLPDFVVTTVELATRSFEVASEEEVVWRPGDAVPAGEPAPAIQWKPAADVRETRRCQHCGDHVELARARDLGMCPACGARWSDD